MPVATNPYARFTTAGKEISSTYEGRHVAVLESDLVHPTTGDGFVDKGQPCVAGRLVGVALEGADAATDYVEIDTEGIWALDVKGHDGAADAAIAFGDVIYIDAADALLDVDTSEVPFGIALGAVASGATTTIAVKVHAGLAS